MFTVNKLLWVIFIGYKMKIYLIAGEESGDFLGYNLMSGIKKLFPEVEFCGIGGSLM